MSLLLLLASLAMATSAEAAKIRITLESPGGLQQNVYLTRPLKLAPDRPVVFVIHGNEQEAAEVRDQWHELALKHEFLLVVPQFEGRQFPDSDDYSLGNLFDENGRPRPGNQTYFAMIEPIFDDVRARYGMTARRYAIYGASAGAQFVQRFLYFVPEARVVHAVVAEADWYTMPALDIRFPHGLNGTPVGENQLVRALQRPLTVLLDAQSTARLERGRAFIEAAQLAADRAVVPLGWRSVVVPEEAGAGMAEAAIPYLLPAVD